MWHWHERERIPGWQEAAANGDTEAMLHLARAAKHSHRPDAEAEAEAERWLRSAADLGNLEAVHKLGVMLCRRGEQEDGEALVQSAALKGHQDAIAMMGQLCERRGDLEGADAWFCKVSADDDSS